LALEFSPLSERIVSTTHATSPGAKTRLYFSPSERRWRKNVCNSPRTVRPELPTGFDVMILSRMVQDLHYRAVGPVSGFAP